MVPLRLAAELMDKNCTPYSFLKFFVRKTRDWKEDDVEFQDYLIVWAVEAISVDNKTTGKA